MKLKKNTVAIRFHLAAGSHYKHWQIKDSEGGCVYFDPKETVIVMENAKLCNYRRTAESIFYGGNKTVCAWIEVANRDYSIIRPHDKAWKLGTRLTNVTPVSYNPRVAPHWVRQGENADGMIIPSLITAGYSINEVQMAIA